MVGVQRKIRTHLDLLSIPRIWGQKCRSGGIDVDVILGNCTKLFVANYKLFVVWFCHDDGFLPRLTGILLTQCYYHRRTRLNAITRLCICSL